MKPEKLRISNELCRRIILYSQLLDYNNKISNGPKGFLEVINRLGYIQIDTISVINRSHHHTFFTRNNSYREKIIDKLQKDNRSIFEYWGHAMSYLPMSDFRYYIPRMKNFSKPENSKWTKIQYEKAGNLLKPVLKRIKEEGPLCSKDFEREDGKKGGTWWDWKPAKSALELLFWRGDLMVSHRNKFTKYYDLKERVLPANINMAIPTKNELAEFIITRAIKAHGLICEREILNFLQPASSRDSVLQSVSKAFLAQTIKRLVEEKSITEVFVEKSNIPYYTTEKLLNLMDKQKLQEPKLFLLSPFDNLIIQRKRIKELFDFDYTLECYVPEQKRKFGYFVLPILYGNNFIGRLDPKADRKSGTIIIKNLLFEKEFKSFDEIIIPLSTSLAELAKFNNCTTCEFVNGVPKKIFSKLKKEIKTLI